MNIITVGLDLAKNVFHVIGMNAHGKGAVSVFVFQKRSHRSWIKRRELIQHVF